MEVDASYQVAIQLGLLANSASPTSCSVALVHEDEDYNPRFANASSEQYSSQQTLVNCRITNLDQISQSLSDHSLTDSTSKSAGAPSTE